MADSKQRNQVVAEVREIKPFPAKELANFLYHDQLAMRLAALELLEEQAGTDFDFDPWKAPDTPDNIKAFERWLEWSTDIQGFFDDGKQLLSEKQRMAYLSDLLSGDFNRAARATQMLEYDGMASVGFLEEYLVEHPTISPAGHSSIRCAQYQITLSTAFGDGAATIARHLAFGNRDQMLTALGKLKSSGLLALPVINEFLDHSDPLVRETAIEAMLSSGGHKALPTVEPILAKETDPNVIHGALRQIKKLKGEESLKIALGFLDEDNEDLKISAIQACELLMKSGGMHSSQSNHGKVNDLAEEGIIAALSDKRWRVRAAALECVAKREIKAAGDECVRLLEDPDDFVTHKAITAIKALRLTEGSDKLRGIFMENPDQAGLALGGYAALGKKPDAEMLSKLSEYPPDVRMTVVQVAANESGLDELLLVLARDEDLDVACAALREVVSDSDALERADIMGLVTAALNSGTPQKQAAVIDQIRLPQSKAGLDQELGVKVESLVGEASNEQLDQIYVSLLEAAQLSAKTNPGADLIVGSHKDLIEAITRIAESDDKNWFDAALALSRSNYKQGHRILLERYDQLTTGQRASTVRNLYEPKTRESLDLLSRLIREPIDEIRNNAVESCFSAQGTDAFIAMALGALSEPDSKLKPHDYYSYRLESAISNNNSSSKAIRQWARESFADEALPDAQRILALIILRQNTTRSDHEAMAEVGRSAANKWVRRATWHALGKASGDLGEHLEAIAGDSSPYVRQVIPALYSKIDLGWIHHFDDIHQRRDSSWSHRDNRAYLNEKLKQILEKQANHDPSPLVRYHALVALLSHGVDIDVASLAKLLRDRPESERASYRIADWMKDNLTRIGPGLAPLAAALKPTEVSPEDMALIVSRTNPSQEKDDLTSFAALAERAQQSSSAPQQVDAGPTGNEGDPATRESLLVVYFFKPGCNECEEAQRMLEVMRRDFALLEVQKHNINETDSTLLNQALCSRYNVPPTDHNIAPAIFTQAGYLIRDDIKAPSIAELLSDTMAMGQDDSWASIDEPEIEEAKKTIETRYKSLTLPIVIIAGLIDGINPCAFATIIFFLSYLQIARRSRLEMLQVGIAFILAVFIAYFCAGLFLHKVLEKVTDQIAGIKTYLDWVFAGLALIAAGLSFRDAARAKQGKLSEMTLTLPESLKGRIRSVIRISSKSRHYVITAFVAGIVISFLELACTGQVYAPIIYSIQQGKLDAVAWLAAYNLAFILPLVIIFVMAITGMSNQRLIEFQQRHTFGVKIGLGLVFVLLAALILFGTRLLH